MTRSVVIQPVSRIEGHAKITIDLDDAGEVARTAVNVVELRGFEKFCEGRPLEELPRIVPRICGVCPWAHHLASAKACDRAFGATIPSAAAKLREAAYMAHMIHSHVLHFFILAGPDFVMGPDADYSVRNVVGIVNKAPDIAKQVVRARFTAQMITQKMAGKAIHPDAAVPGGWSRPLVAEELAELKTMTQECLDFARFAIGFAKKDIFPQYLDTVKTLGVIETGFLGTVRDGALNLYDGDLRLMRTDGTWDEFRSEDYLDHIGEHVEPWTYLKFPYAKRWASFSMEPGEQGAIYRTNALARINVCDRITTPEAQAELEEFRQAFGRPAQLTLLYHWARLIETLYAAEHLQELLADEEILEPATRVTVEPRAGRGVGVVEAPRGTLIHDYESDEQGAARKVNIIVGTTHNNAAINMSVKQAATSLIHQGEYDEGILNKVEMAIRAYDPCLSCATHTFDGTVAVDLRIRDASGAQIARMSN